MSEEESEHDEAEEIEAEDKSGFYLDKYLKFSLINNFRK
jgi:hypothetical protein